MCGYVMYNPHATHSCLVIILSVIKIMKLTMEPFVFKLRLFYAVLAPSVGVADSQHQRHTGAAQSRKSLTSIIAEPWLDEDVSGCLKKHLSIGRS